MDISNNTNISARIASSISKLNLNTARRAFEVQKDDENTSNIELQDIKKSDIQLIEGKKATQTVKSSNGGINVEEIQQYANLMGENLSIDDINYGLMYGRSVIADFSA